MLNVTDFCDKSFRYLWFKIEYIIHSNITKLNKNQIFRHMLLFTSDSFFSNQIKQFHFLFYIYDQL